MDTVTLPRKEYQSLTERALRYDYLAEIVKTRENIFAPPPTRDAKEVIKDFQATGLHNKSFLKSLEKGLRRSSYFRK